MESFWKPIRPIKNKFNLSINIYPKRTKKEVKLVDKNPFGDSDKDKVMNWFDCKPLNKRNQDKIRIVEAPSEAIGYITAGQFDAGEISVPEKIPQVYRETKSKLPDIRKKEIQLQRAREFFRRSRQYKPERRVKFLYIAANVTGAFDAQKELDSVKYSVDPKFREDYERKRQIWANEKEKQERYYPKLKMLSKRELESKIKKAEKLVAEEIRWEEKSVKERKESYKKDIKKLKAGFSKKELMGAVPILEDTFISLNVDMYKPIGIPERDKRKLKEMKQTVAHEGLHYLYKKAYKTEKGAEKEKSRKKLFRLRDEEFQNVKRWVREQAAKQPEKIKKKLIQEIETVNRYYFPIQGAEDLAIRIVTEYPQIAYNSKNLPETVKKVIAVNKGKRIYGKTIYTKEEYTQVPTAPEILNVLPFKDSLGYEAHKVGNVVVKKPKMFINKKGVLVQEFVEGGELPSRFILPKKMREHNKRLSIQKAIEEGIIGEPKKGLSNEKIEELREKVKEFEPDIEGEEEELYKYEPAEEGEYTQEIESKEKYEPSEYEIGGYSPEDFEK